MAAFHHRAKLPHPGNPFATNKMFTPAPAARPSCANFSQIELADLPSDFEQGLPLTEVLRKLKNISKSNDDRLAQGLSFRRTPIALWPGSGLMNVRPM